MVSIREPEKYTAKPTLSVILPTLNCRQLLGDHIESMRKWMHQAEEIVVVDSHSDDGTLEMILESLDHPRVFIHQRPRGLYQSWNFGISQARGEYLYISTVGDSITLEGIEHLLTTARDLDADVVISGPDFIRENGLPIKGPTWPVEHIVKMLNITKPRILNPLTSMLFQMMCLPDAILGSSASNLYRTRMMWEKPFPIEFGTVGDGAWGLANFPKCTLAVTPWKFSTFREHEKSYNKKTYYISDLNDRLFKLLSETIQREIANDGYFADKCGSYKIDRILSLIAERTKLQFALEIERSRAIPWVMNPSAWKRREERQYVSDKARGLIFNALAHENPECNKLDKNTFNQLISRRFAETSGCTVLKNDVTFLFYHYGRIPRYLNHAIEHVRIFNPHAEIYLITDGIKDISGLEKYDICHYPIGKYTSEKLSRFREVYQHVSCFDEKFERFVLERWFVTEIIRSERPNRVYIMQDSDVAVFGDVSRLIPLLPKVPICLSSCNPHFTFIRGDVSEFLDYILGTYLDKKKVAAAKGRFLRQEDPDQLFTLGEMQFMFEYLALEKGMKMYNTETPVGYVDCNIHIPEKFESLKLRRRPRKKVYWRKEKDKAIPYFKRGEELVKAFILHFQGPGKRVFKPFNRLDDPASSLEIWWWNQIFQRRLVANLM
jgi:glycosyltransferase involved in cell wall biosynthesis